MHSDPPRSTYRLQLHAGFTFGDATALVPYFAALGISHLYLSPVLQAAPGSTHGYDVVDPGRVDAERGGEAGLRTLARAADAAGIGLVADLVPNHLHVGPPQRANAAWWRLLREGRRGAGAVWFDVDWVAGDDRVHVPVLADESAAREVVRDGDAVRYHEHEFPWPDKHYRLVPWRQPPNYRRFFDVTTLAGVRVEEPAVFDATHGVVERLVGEGVLQGLRIDHPDGLAEPREYLDRLAARTGGIWTVVEKILEPGEALPAEWRCAGTTGYDAMRMVDAAFVDPAGLPVLDALWREVAGPPASWEHVVEQSKRDVLDGVLRPEVERLLRLLGPAQQWREPLVELLVAFPVYRTYLERRGPSRPADLAVLERARDVAVARRPYLAEGVATLLERIASGAEPELTRVFQQTTGPVMAKGLEDTAGYRYLRLVALNEVGGDPECGGVDADTFHTFFLQRQRHSPAALNALSTHDTKRSGDVRARLLALSELADPWCEAARRWIPRLVAHGVPDRPTAYLALQTLVGAWPVDEGRLTAYCEKATREAKLRTSWTDPDPEYDAAVRQGLVRALADDGLVAELAGFVARLTPVGRRNALGAALVHLTAPGVPDVYQGTELEELSLVDPDNRRPVDYARRARLLAELDGGMDVDSALDRVEEGAPKLLVTARALRLRRELPAAFRGGYEPLPARGERSDRLLAFVRGGEVVTVVPRRTASFVDWGDTAVTLPAGRWRDVLSGGRHGAGKVRVADLLARFPVALLVREHA